MQKLSVYPNPFSALGPDGMPIGRVLVEPGHPRPFDVVGGKLAKVRVERKEDERHSKKARDAARRLDVRDPLVRGVATVRMRPVAVSQSQYMKERIAAGDLVAADKATYVALFGPASGKNFRQALDLLNAALTKRMEEWRAINGSRPAIAGYVLVQNGEEIALAAKDAKKRPVPAPAKPAERPVLKPTENKPGRPGLASTEKRPDAPQRSTSAPTP